MERPFLFSQLESIYYSRFRITFEASDTLHLPIYKGSTYRGAFGNALRHQVCRYPGQECDSCKWQHNCLSAYLFSERLNGSTPSRRYSLPPRPYIISPHDGLKSEYDPGESFGFDLLLIGEAIHKLAPVLPAVIRQMGNAGFGRYRQKANPASLLHQVESGIFEPLPAIGQPHERKVINPANSGKCDMLALQLETPLRLLSGGKPQTEPPSFTSLITNLAIRMSLLANLYCNAEWVDVYDLKPDPEVQVASLDLTWVNWQRFSGTQNKKMKFDGYTGYITYTGKLSEWMPLIKAGETLHAGSTASFGLGKYKIMPNE